MRADGARTRPELDAVWQITENLDFRWQVSGEVREAIEADHLERPQSQYLKLTIRKRHKSLL
jgi:hypothetical protein